MQSGGLRFCGTHALVMEYAELERELSALLEERKHPPEYLQWLIVKAGRRLLLLDVTGIIWLEAQGNYVRVHHEQGSHLLRQSMSSLEHKLNPRHFLRIRRSVMVRIDRIKEFQRWLHGEYLVILQNGTQLMLTRSYRSRLLASI